MKLRSIKKTILGNEQGQAVLFGAFFAMALLVLGGLVVDTAHVFLRKSQLQRAMDASAMAGITRYWSGETDIESIENAAVELVRYNLRQTGVKDDEISTITAALTVDENQVATLVIIGALAVPTLFMRLIPGEGLDTIAIAGSSTSRRNPAILSLILDASGSMSCNGGCPEKFQALKDAANIFVDSFEDNLDQMAVVRFSDKATLSYPMSLINKTAIHNAINGLSAGGWTNISEASSMARKQIESINNPDGVRVIVLFTDGAPNNWRATFLNGRSPLTRNYPSPGTALYYNYILVPGASPITVNTPSTMAVKCAGQGSQDVRNCFTSLAYKDSREVTRPGSSSISRTSRPAMRRESYHLSIVETDYAKDDGITIYTIGLGTQAAESTDPYQVVDDDQNIKSYLLKRIANDPAGADDPEFPSLPNDASHPAGVYFQTPDPGDLASLFEAVARRIKLRLIE